MTTNITDIRMEHLTTETETAGTTITVRFTGSAEADAKAHLDTYCKAAHEAALNSGVKDVVLDFRALQFMNSSCLNAFVTWIGAVQDTAPAKQYHFRFLSDPKQAWQGRCLAALTCFAVDLITVDTV